MDITVKPAADGASWAMVDLLGRSMGRIVQAGSTLSIEPAGHAIETMQSMKHGPFATLDDALREIETHTRGTCQLQEAPAAPPGGSIPVDKLNASNDE
ncbi:hypothetical protein PY365_29255 [Roseiarcaceae bacterium H3SJ34-1]|uniref:hypothetical protein n=1 Tax=Terripilifer ovatus TaxID=3032367 RepID=UPI003AB93DC4|nr:hypothetical protein [Roseiarcaceae bacterium H3SJ34-1]